MPHLLVIHNLGGFKIIDKESRKEVYKHFAKSYEKKVKKSLLIDLYIIIKTRRYFRI